MRRDELRPAFPSTRWSRILAPGGARDLDALARAYWGPAQAYLAARQRCSFEDAADLAQEAFAWLLASKLLDKADPARGRFRGFLKRALANFAIEQARKAGAEKRGGGSAHVSLAAASEAVDPHGTPEQALDDAWRRELLERAHAQLRRELEDGGRAAYYRVFRDWFFVDIESGAAPRGHAELAALHGISKTDVSNWLDYAKQRYRALLHDVVADTVSTAEELDDEVRWLLGARGRTP